MDKLLIWCRWAFIIMISKNIFLCIKCYFDYWRYLQHPRSNVPSLSSPRTSHRRHLIPNRALEQQKHQSTTCGTNRISQRTSHPAPIVLCSIRREQERAAHGAAQNHLLLDRKKAALIFTVYQEEMRKLHENFAFILGFFIATDSTSSCLF